MTITNGTIKYGHTVKTGDFENKRGDVELSFNVAEGQDAGEVLDHVRGVAHRHLHTLLGLEGTRETVAAPKAPKPPKPAAKAAAEAPKPVEKPAAATSGAEEVEDPGTPAYLKGKMLDPATGKPVVETKPEDEDLGDLLGGGEPAKEITDKELTDATQKCQAAVKNAPAIRKILADLGIKTPPGRIIDLPQEKRQTYLDKLKEVKPLA